LAVPSIDCSAASKQSAETCRKTSRVYGASSPSDGDMPFHGSICPTGVSSSDASADLFAGAVVLRPPCSGSVCVVASNVGRLGAVAGAAAGAGAGVAAAATSEDAALCKAAGDGPDLAGSMVPSSTIRQTRTRSGSVSEA